MGTLEDLRDKALATAGKVADKSVTLARAAGDKAKLLGRITKLKTEVAMERDLIKKSYVEIGRRYYEAHKHNPDPDMAQVMTEISIALDAMDKKQQEVEKLKKQLSDDYGEIMEDIEETVEEVVEKVLESEE